MNKNFTTASSQIFAQISQAQRDKQHSLSAAELLALYKQVELALRAEGKLNSMAWRRSQVETTHDLKSWRAIAKEPATDVVNVIEIPDLAA